MTGILVRQRIDLCAIGEENDAEMPALPGGGDWIGLLRIDRPRGVAAGFA
jgi:hypothetical protein